MKNNVCIICLNVDPSINSQSVNSLGMTAYVCMCVCVWYVCVGGLCDRQTVKVEPGSALPMPTNFKFSQHFVYIDGCK